jgi:molecular chaperone DnaJ
MDFYIVLGLKREATTADVKRAYRRLARRFHPDINPGDREAASRFRQIVDAYETLVDPDRRRRYDSGSLPPSSNEANTFGFAGFDFSGAVVGDRATTFGELFEEVFARRAERPAHPDRGADLHTTISLSFEDAWHGSERQVSVTRQVACRACAGSGYHRTAETPCVACEGSGAVRSVRGHMVFSKNCPHCGGAGRLRQSACDVCRGLGVELRAETLTVKVPIGIVDGARMRVPAKGHSGVRGAPPGDLYVDVEVRPHHVYRRDGDDVHFVVPVAIHEAALGAKLDIPTPDGMTRLRVPAGTQSGQRFRLRERGALSPRTGRRGDLIVEVRVMLPKVLDERSKELLREFGRLNTESVRPELDKLRDAGTQPAGDVN